MCLWFIVKSLQRHLNFVYIVLYVSLSSKSLIILKVITREILMSIMNGFKCSNWFTNGSNNEATTKNGQKSLCYRWTFTVIRIPFRVVRYNFVVACSSLIFRQLPTNYYEFLHNLLSKYVQRKKKLLWKIHGKFQLFFFISSYNSESDYVSIELVCFEVHEQFFLQFVRMSEKKNDIWRVNGGFFLHDSFTKNSIKVFASIQ